jgi:hypothetical protein
MFGRLALDSDDAVIIVGRFALNGGGFGVVVLWTLRSRIQTTPSSTYPVRAEQDNEFFLRQPL